MARPEPFPLFKGCTRVPCVMGVPLTPIVAMVVVVAALAMVWSLWWWLAAPPAWFLMAQITRNDDKAFRIVWLWLDTKVRNRNKGLWAASSYAPADSRRRGRAIGRWRG